MGYNTTVLILNDALGDIENDPEGFVKNLRYRILSGESGDVKAGCHGRAAYVMRTEHADYPRVYVTHGNGIWEITEDAGGSRAQGNSWLRDYYLKYLRVAERRLTGMKKTLQSWVPTDQQQEPGHKEAD
jgi:hypothetical protein